MVDALIVNAFVCHDHLRVIEVVTIFGVAHETRFCVVGQRVVDEYVCGLLALPAVKCLRLRVLDVAQIRQIEIGWFFVDGAEARLQEFI